MHEGMVTTIPKKKKRKLISVTSIFHVSMKCDRKIISSRGKINYSKIQDTLSRRS